MGGHPLRCENRVARPISTPEHHGEKVAMVVRMTLNEMRTMFSNLSDVFLSQRIRLLVDEEFIEGQGDLWTDAVQ